MSVRDRFQDALLVFPRTLGRLGLVDREKGTEAFDLALPVMVTGAIRTIHRVADFFMVSLALTDAAVAGLAFAFQYYFIGFGLALALASGTISVVSRFKGAGEHARADLAVKQSVWLSLALSAPLMAAAWLYAAPLIELLTDDPEVIRQGAIYLEIVMLAVWLRFWTIIASQALAGSADTRTPMYVNLLTVPTNIALNAALIFGLGPFPELGIAGAAIGTVLANVIGAVIFAGIFASGSYNVRLRLEGPQFDFDIVYELVRVSTPIAGARLVNTFGRFPFLFVLGVLGTPVVAAYAIGRRLIMLAMMPAWGYSTASSTLVGQAIGGGEDQEATEYGWATLRIALITQLLFAAVMVAFARPLAELFNTEHVDLTVNFARLFGVAVGGMSIARTMQGGLRGAGDTTWPFYGRFVGVGLRLLVGFLALPSGMVLFSLGTVAIAPGMGLGVAAIYAAILLDMYTQAGVNTYRFWTGKWQAVARKADAATDWGD